MQNVKQKQILVILVVVVAVVAVPEIILRKMWGFGDMVLFQEDKNFEYIALPNQNRLRFGKKSVYNEYSMRSYPLNSQDTCLVLGFGDSVLNGGTIVDQDSLATTIVDTQLGAGQRFLNISAGSWGPDNCAEYLKKYGDFKPIMLILFVSSHDAHDNMTREKTVGEHVSYPDKQYPLATLELIFKYVIPRVFGLGQGHNALMINKNGDGFNSGFEFFNTYAREHSIPLVVCLHAETSELEQNKFNKQGEEIINFCKEHNLRLISGLEIGERASQYRDKIHLNEQGQKLWSTVLLQEIKNTVNCSSSPKSVSFNY